MSSTKIVIIVLVLVGLLFIIFVARGALRNEAPPPKGKNLGSSAKKQRRLTGPNRQRTFQFTATKS